MPSVASSHTVTAYTSARDLPQEVWTALYENQRNSNVMLPYAKKARQDPALCVGSNVWLVCSTSLPGSRTTTVDFVLSCTEGPLGSYPIFIYTPTPYTQLDAQHYVPRLRSLVQSLQESVPPERVFSVFAFDVIARTFASLWTKTTGIGLERDPEYYAANFTYCTKATFQSRRLAAPRDVAYYDLRRAGKDDLKHVAELCRGFAATSEPFTLTESGAEAEAALLIQNRQVWVHEVRALGHPERAEIASIVAVTRTSDTVAGITKVYTNPRWRQRGCAERLVRHVCQQFLQSKESIVLYVAHNNPTAAKVYHRVGFIGLSEDDGDVEGVDPWLELGFEQEKIELGHW
ncbi:hypothetical protein DAEQUDRAFT_734567 [Daedalea quercina L-15889]|uniref:N-acetyltransferase domain-containing protein n=1 Tax=Daedalea quercina L-15889 TaxID=1314783 RepID=A0A165ULL3_9APHY|nr:hypothetical protein DAEQUDRAFT_734567 [Daedalea quercina L-15889]